MAQNLWVPWNPWNPCHQSHCCMKENRYLQPGIAQSNRHAHFSTMKIQSTIYKTFQMSYSLNLYLNLHRIYKRSKEFLNLPIKNWTFSSKFHTSGASWGKDSCSKDTFFCFAISHRELVTIKFCISLNTWK